LNKKELFVFYKLSGKKKRTSAINYIHNHLTKQENIITNSSFPLEKYNQIREVPKDSSYLLINF
jgi:hypothetical protein